MWTLTTYVDTSYYKLVALKPSSHNQSMHPFQSKEDTHSMQIYTCNTR
jgi:hypothetical protein